MAYYAEPRETKDIDVNVFLPVGRWPAVHDALAPLGVDVEIDEGELEAEAQVELDWEENPVHLFFSCDALHEEMARAVRTVPLNGTPIPLVSPEHLVIRKTLLDRLKDWRDIEQILARHPSLNHGEVEYWVRQLRGRLNPSA